MKRILLLLTILSGQAFGQTSSADSLKSALRALTGKERLPVLLALVNKIETKAPQEALSLAAEGLSLAVKEGDKEKEAAFLSSTAFCYSLTGDFALALKYGNQTLELSRQIGNKGRMATAHNTLGTTYTFMGLYSKALEHNLEALRIREELSLETASIQSMNNIGILYHHAGQYEKAIDYYQRILQRTAQKPDTSRTVILAKLNIGFAEYKLGRLNEAMKNDQEALDLSLKANNSTVAYAYFNVGIVDTDMRKYAEALKYLRLSLAEYEKQDQKHGRVQVLNALGRLYLLTGDLAQAIPYVKESAALSRQIHARDELKASYELIAALYEKQGNAAEAYRYYKLYAATKDSIFNVQESDRLADISMRIVTLKKDNEIESLQKEKVIASLKLEKEHYYSTILFVVLVSLTAIIAILFRYSGKLRHGRTLLETNNAELARLNTELHEKIREIRTLSGLLPICAWCKNIRDDKGYWQQLEGYIADRTAAQFSHSICPACAEREFPESRALAVPSS